MLQADLGVAALFLGSGLAVLLAKAAGGNQEARLKNLFLELKGEYAVQGVPVDRQLRKLTATMLSSSALSVV